MLFIETETFNGYSQNDLLTYFQTHGEVEFCLSLIKTMHPKKNTFREVAHQYGFNVWLSDQICTMDHEFTYEVPDPSEEPGEFMYWFNTTDMEWLAEILYEISVFYGNGSKRELIEASFRLQDYLEGIIVMACSDIYDIYKEYLGYAGEDGLWDWGE